MVESWKQLVEESWAGTHPQSPEPTGGINPGFPSYPIVGVLNRVAFFSYLFRPADVGWWLQPILNRNQVIPPIFPMKNTHPCKVSRMKPENHLMSWKTLSTPLSAPIFGEVMFPGRLYPLESKNLRQKKKHVFGGILFAVFTWQQKLPYRKTVELWIVEKSFCLLVDQRKKRVDSREKFTWGGVAPSQDASDHQDYCIFNRGSL